MNLFDSQIVASAIEAVAATITSRTDLSITCRFTATIAIEARHLHSLRIGQTMVKECNGDIPPTTKDSVQLSVRAMSWKPNDGAWRGDTTMPRPKRESQQTSHPSQAARGRRRVCSRHRQRK